MPSDQSNAAQVSVLVTRAKQGDREAFDGLVGLYTPQIYNLALRITGSSEDAEDCVQDAFLRAFSRLHTFRGEAAFSTWLFRVAINVANDTAKRRARQPLPASQLAAADSDGEGPDLETIAGGSAEQAPTPDEAAILRQRRDIVLAAVQSLPEHHRAVVLLYDFQGLSYDEIARITGTRVGTVKSRLNRARLALKELLTPHLELLRD